MRVLSEASGSGGAAIAAPGPAVPPDIYVGVHMLRGVAALMVVVFHTGLMLQARLPEVGDAWVLRFGAAGVDVFFPISGFVMLISTRTLLGRPGDRKSTRLNSSH